MKYYDALDNILDRPIAFNPSFKKITGSTNAALLLSQAFYWTKRTKDADGWFYKTREEWMEETGLTESELDGAREKCRSTGVIEEKLKGVPATIHYRVVKRKVYELLGVQIPEFPESSFPPNSQIPEKPESDFSGDFNRNTENTSGNTSVANDEKPDLVDLELQKKAKRDGIEPALQAFERDMQTPGNWSWYPAKTTLEKEWRELREFVVNLYAENPNCFTEYNTWRNEPYAKGAMSNRQIKNYPSDFQASWSDFVIRTKMYGKNNQKPESNVKRSSVIQYDDDGTPITF